ncbi:MAG TPA: hypothetical protein VHY18_11985 [Solirubrobacteraceae bacterium]|jgi:hypothetical protein|nr:hypothetical protein [Solirubrobacteraceae bacterium]
MSTSLLERSPALDEGGDERNTSLRLDGSLFVGMSGAHGRLTLDELITGVWEGLAVHGSVDCPVCTSPMVPSSHDDGDGRQTGSCLGCGSKLC